MLPASTTSAEQPAAGRRRAAVLTHQTSAQQIAVGARVVERLPGVLGATGTGAVGVIASPRTWSSALGRAAEEQLRDFELHLWDDVQPHTPLANALAAGQHWRERQVGRIVAIGGGSASDLAKAVAVVMATGGEVERFFARRRADGTVTDSSVGTPLLPIVTLPTTLSGAEVTPGAGVTESGMKHVLWDQALASRVVLYETSDSNEMPDSVAAGTGMNAIAHCVEAMYSTQGSAVSDALAERALDLLTEGLLRRLAGPEKNAEVRGLMYTGAAMAGMALTNARVCLHHAVCHVLGARYGVAHGDANAVMLSHVADLNRDASEAPQRRCLAILRGAVERVRGRPLAAQSFGAALREFQTAIGAPTSLPAIGLPAVDVAAVQALLAPERGLAFNPRPVGAAEIEQVLTAALAQP